MRIVRRGFGVCPRCKSGNLLLGQRRIVGKVAAAEIGEPRRHLAGGDGVTERGCLDLRLLISDQGHGSNFACAVTALAVLLEDGQNVFVKRRRRGLTSGTADAHQRPSHSQQQNQSSTILPHEKKFLYLFIPQNGGGGDLLLRSIALLTLVFMRMRVAVLPLSLRISVIVRRWRLGPLLVPPAATQVSWAVPGSRNR